MLDIKNLSKSYNDKTVLCSLSFSANTHDRIVVMGGSGRGKTTLLRIIAGLEVCDSGSVTTHGENIAVMFQEPRLLPWKNAIDNVRVPLGADRAHLADKYFEAVGLSLKGDSQKMPHELSGGMKQRVALARFLAYAEASGASLLLLDEPFSALDDDTAEKMLALLKSFSEDKILLVVTHNEKHAESLGSKIIRI